MMESSKETWRQRNRNRFSPRNPPHATDGKDMTTATAGFSDPGVKSLSLEVARPSVYRQVQQGLRQGAGR